MGKTSEETAKRHRVRIPDEQKRNPAIGVTASDLELDAVLRVVVRANSYDHFVFVAVSDSSDPLVDAVAEKFDAVVVQAGDADDVPAATLIDRMARALGFPGVLHVSDADARVDFSECEAVLADADGFSTDAPLTSEPEWRTVETVAAIPAYNEADTIAEVVADVRPQVDEVVVVDDGSTDATFERATAAGATVLRHEDNRGYGAALKTALSEAARRDVAHLVVVDGDGQHEAGDIPKLLDVQRETGADIVVGNRFRDGGERFVPRYRRFGLWVINVLTNLTMSVFTDSSWVSDTQSGFRAYDRDVIESLAADDSISDGMGASTDILYHARTQGYDIEEVGTTIQYDGGETSTRHPVRHGFSLLNNILRTVEQHRPMTFFGIPGLALVFVGFGTAYWSFFSYVRTGGFPAELLFVCAACTFVGFPLAFVGMLAHTFNLYVERLADGPS